MYVDTLPVGPLQTNCYLITCAESGEAALIDPGWKQPAIFEAIARRAAVVKIILNTHAHWDHIGGNAELVRSTGAVLAVPEGDLPLLRKRGGADEWGIPLEPSPEPDRLLAGGEIIEVGTLRLMVLFTPGHTPGHVCFYESTHRALFDGDVLFNGGIGRTDLPGGNMADLMRSIRDVLFGLPADTVVYPGHGPHTTIGNEQRYNPWLSG